MASAARVSLAVGSGIPSEPPELTFCVNGANRCPNRKDCKSVAWFLPAACVAASTKLNESCHRVVSPPSFILADPSNKKTICGLRVAIENCRTMVGPIRITNTVPIEAARKPTIPQRSPAKDCPQRRRTNATIATKLAPKPIDAGQESAGNQAIQVSVISTTHCLDWLTT